MTGERKEPGESKKGEPKKVRTLGPTLLGAPLDAQGIIATFLDLISQASLDQASRETRLIVAKGRLVLGETYLKNKGKKLLDTWRRHDASKTFKSVQDVLDNENGYILLASGLISRRDIYAEAEVRSGFALLGPRANDAVEVSKTLRLILAIPNFKDLCFKRIIHARWLRLSTSEVPTILTPGYFAGLAAQLFPQFEFDSRKEAINIFFQAMLSPEVFPVFESKALTYKQAKEIAEAPRSESGLHAMGFAVKLLQVLASLHGIQALKEGLIDVPTALKLSRKRNKSGHSRGRLLDDDVEVALEREPLQTLLSESGLIALRKGFIDVWQLANAMQLCRYPKYSDTYFIGLQEHEVLQSKHGAEADKEIKLNPREGSLFKLDQWRAGRNGTANALEYQCKVLCTPSGIEAMENAPPLITWNRACFYSADTLAAILTPNGVKAMKENLITLERAAELNAWALGEFFKQPNSIRALKENLFDLEQLRNYKTVGDSENFKLILSDEGLKALKEGRITTHDALYCSSVHLEFLLSPKSAAVLEEKEGWLRKQDVLSVKPELLKLLSNESAKKAFRAGWLNVEMIQKWSSEQLALMLSPNGLIALEARLIPEKYKTDSDYIGSCQVLQQLISDRGLVALSEGVIQFDSARQMKSAQLAEALKTPAMAVKIVEDQAAGRYQPSAPLPETFKIDPQGDEKKCEATIRGERAELEALLVNQLKDRIRTMSARDVTTAILGIRDGLHTQFALQSRYHPFPPSVSPKEMLEWQMNILNRAFREIVLDQARYPDFPKKKDLLTKFKEAYSDLVNHYLAKVQPSGDDLESFKVRFVHQSHLVNLHRDPVAAHWNKESGSGALPHDRFFSPGDTHKGLVKMLGSYEAQEAKVSKKV